MGKQEKRVLTLDRYEHGVVVNALNEMRNDLLEEERPTDIVDEVLLKVIDAPAKKVRCRNEFGIHSRHCSNTPGPQLMPIYKIQDL